MGTHVRLGLSIFHHRSIDCTWLGGAYTTGLFKPAKLLCSSQSLFVHHSERLLCDTTQALEGGKKWLQWHQQFAGQETSHKKVCAVQAIAGLRAL